jgi:hypothetical protein
MARGGTHTVRHLNDEETEARKRYILAHPGEAEPMPTTAGYPVVQDWIDAGEPAAGS